MIFGVLGDPSSQIPTLDRRLNQVRTRAVEAPKKKAVKKAPATGGCSRLLRRLYIVNAAKRLQGDRPCSCDHFEMRLTSVRPSVQKL